MNSFLSSILFLIALPLSFSKATNPNVQYELVIAESGGEVRLELFLESNRSISGFVLYSNPLDRTPYDDIPIERFALEANSPIGLGLIRFPASELSKHPIQVEILTSQTDDAELDELAQIFRLIPKYEDDPAKLGLLQSEFASRLSQWNASPDPRAIPRSSAPSRPVSIGGAPPVRSENVEEAPIPSARGIISLDKDLRGLAIIEIPSGE